MSSMGVLAATAMGNLQDEAATSRAKCRPEPALPTQRADAPRRASSRATVYTSIGQVADRYKFDTSATSAGSAGGTRSRGPAMRQTRYQLIAEELRGRIASGEFGAGRLLPSEAEL